MIKIRLAGKHSDKFALVDDEDAERVIAAGPWFFNERRGAVVAAIPGGGKRPKRRLLHRWLMGLEKGDPRQTDHRDRNPLNNQRRNLRVVTHAQNRQNVGSYRGSRSQYRGVCWHGVGRKWLAYGQVGGKQTHLGLHKTEEAAAEAAAAWRREHMPYSEEAAS